MEKIEVIWDLTKPLPSLRISEKVVLKVVGKNQLTEVRKMLVGKLIEDRFEFVCDFQGQKVFRKRK